MTDTKYYLDKREWLNPKRHEDSGAIQYYVSHDGYGWVDGSLTIWDCGRKVTLNLSFSSQTAAKQRAIKVNKLIHALEEMKKALGEAYNDINTKEIEIEDYD